MKREEIFKRIKKCSAELHDTYNVSALFIFGSVARDENTKNSDVDIIVEFKDSNVGLFEFSRLKEFLEKKLTLKVDLVTRDAIKESLRAQIEKDSIRAA